MAGAGGQSAGEPGEPGHTEAAYDRLHAEVERERQHAADAAARYERRARELAAVFEGTHAMLALLDRDFNFRMVNSAYEEGCGHTAAELIGQSHFKFFPHEENQGIFTRVRDTGEPYYTIEKPFQRPGDPEGAVTFWNWSLIPVKGEAGAIEGLLLSLFDVTPLVLAREQIKGMAQQMDAVFAAMTDGVLVYSRDGIILRANPAAARIHGFDPTGVSHADLCRRCALQRDDEQPLRPEEMPAARSLRGEVVVNMRLFLVAAGGERRIMLVSCSPLCASSGEITGAVSVWRDATEREELLARTQAARADAERAHALSERLMAILGHDLRSPLTAITMTAESLARSEGLDPRARAAVQRIHNSSDRMAAMIRELLDYSRSRAGGIPIAPEPTDLGRLAAQIVDEAKASDPGRAIVLRVEGDGAGIWDPERMKQVIANLITNAIQYGREDAPVEVAIHGRGDVVELSVHNEGPPIPEEARSTLFEPFKRGPAAARARRGVGLGLYIVRELALAHGGSVTVRSTAAEGTRFTVTLPRRR
ncbi:MAG: PAS domain-containing sensor histidine kinase [Polyangiaceae bacterium]|nr:PAS domain-containing sensor histidine kinase [Polyangiaceae bacterium]